MNFTVQVDNPGSYTVWARGMAPDAAGDSLHVGVNDGTPTTAASLTGFAPNAWTWSRLTMSSTNATVDLSNSGTYTLNVWMAEDGLRLDKLLLVTDTATIPTGQGPLESPTTTVLPPLGDQFINYEYDSLHRLTEAIYTGTFSGTYQYEYDAIGNRKTYTTTFTTTEVTTYLYDDANRLTQSTIQGGDTTTYDWDSASRLITTTIASAISRVYGYSQDGDLLSALVDGQTTTFLYDGNGQRLQMAVGSEVTTYTLDYGRSFQVLLEQGGAYATTKHYLYGLACIAEEVDADEPETKEWRYYQRDSSNLVRQTTNEQEDITLAWTFSPEGAVVLGEEGPVTNLDCGNNTTYDWSTGLIFKNGRYFDPNIGIWLTFGGLVIWQIGWKRKFSRYRNRKRKLLLFLLYIFVALSLIGCGPNPTPDILPTSCPTPADLPVPGLPSSTPEAPTNAIGTPQIDSDPFGTPTNLPTLAWLDEWNKFVSDMQDILDERFGTNAIIFNKTDSDSGAIAVPQTADQARKMIDEGTIVVQKLTNPNLDINPLICSCNTLVQVRFDIPIATTLTGNFELYERYFNHDNIELGGDGFSLNTDIVVYGSKNFDQRDGAFHSAIIAWHNLSDPYQSIIIQTNSPSSANGIYYTRVKNDLFSEIAYAVYFMSKK